MGYHDRGGFRARTNSGRGLWRATAGSKRRSVRRQQRHDDSLSHGSCRSRAWHISAGRRAAHARAADSRSVGCAGPTWRRRAERNGQRMSARRRAGGGAARRPCKGARRHLEPVSQRIVDGGPVRGRADRIGNRGPARLAAIYSHDTRRDAALWHRHCRTGSHALSRVAPEVSRPSL